MTANNPSPQDITGNNPNLDIVNINAYTKFGEIISICSGVNQGPKLCYKCAKNEI